MRLKRLARSLLNRSETMLRRRRHEIRRPASAAPAAYCVVICRGPIPRERPTQFVISRGLLLCTLGMGAVLLILHVLLVPPLLLSPPLREVGTLPALRLAVTEAFSPEEAAAISTSIEDLTRRVAVMTEMHQRIRYGLGLDDTPSLRPLHVAGFAGIDSRRSLMKEEP
jgi:hypothetical protein